MICTNDLVLQNEDAKVLPKQPLERSEESRWSLKKQPSTVTTAYSVSWKMSYDNLRLSCRSFMLIRAAQSSPWCDCSYRTASEFSCVTYLIDLCRKDHRIGSSARTAIAWVEARRGLSERLKRSLVFVVISDRVAW